MVSEDCCVRQVGVGDERVVRDLLRACWKNAGYTDAEMDAARSEIWHPDNAAKDLAGAAGDESSGKRGWIAFVDDRPVGIITTKNVDGGLYVDPEGRGKGGGAALVAARDVFRKETGSDVSLAHILASNTACLNFYQKLGYRFNPASQALIDGARRAGIDPAFLKDEKGRSPVLLMTKPL